MRQNKPIRSEMEMPPARSARSARLRANSDSTGESAAASPSWDGWWVWVGHIAEEIRNPIAREISKRIEEQTSAHLRSK